MEAGLSVLTIILHSGLAICMQFICDAEKLEPVIIAWHQYSAVKRHRSEHAHSAAPYFL